MILPLLLEAYIAVRLWKKERPTGVAFEIVSIILSSILDIALVILDIMANEFSDVLGS